MPENKLTYFGKVLFYLRKKGYGFIRENCPACGTPPNIGEHRHKCPSCHARLRDFYYHAKDVLCPSDLPDRYFEGVDVTFQITQGEGRPRALYVDLVKEHAR